MRADRELMPLIMGLTAMHANGCPLDLADVVKIVCFAHDIYGIMRHLDRETGKLADCFTLRFAVAVATL